MADKNATLFWHTPRHPASAFKALFPLIFFCSLLNTLTGYLSSHYFIKILDGKPVFNHSILIVLLLFTATVYFLSCILCKAFYLISGIENNNSIFIIGFKLFLRVCFVMFLIWIVFVFSFRFLTFILDHAGIENAITAARNPSGYLFFFFGFIGIYMTAEATIVSSHPARSLFNIKPWYIESVFFVFRNLKLSIKTIGILFLIFILSKFHFELFSSPEINIALQLSIEMISFGVLVYMFFCAIYAMINLKWNPFVEYPRLKIVYETTDPDHATALDIYLNRECYAKYFIYPGFNHGIEELKKGTFESVCFYVNPVDFNEAKNMVDSYLSNVTEKQD